MSKTHRVNAKPEAKQENNQATEEGKIEVSQDELIQLLALKAEVEDRKRKAIEASKKTRQKRLENATEEQKAEWRAKAIAASKRTNEKKKLQIQEMKAKLAQYESTATA